MQMSVDLAFLLFFLTMMVFRTKTEIFNPENCGQVKILNSTSGVIQTPNFPRPFPVPIRCVWVIDATAYVRHNTENEFYNIYVYFTQLFVTAGLNITEFQLYDAEDRTGYTGHTVIDQMSRNILEGGDQYVWTANQSFLVIDFIMDTLYANQHVRVLPNLMNVYGFNITYEIATSPRPENDICSAPECSFLGHCYASADFVHYYCSCFDGFFGKHCGYGPLCSPTKNSCMNGGQCRYAGGTRIHCACPTEFSGPGCDINLFPNTINITKSCPYNDDHQHTQSPCDCKSGKNALNSVDQVHYSLIVKLSNAAAPFDKNFTKKYFAQRTSEEQIFRQIEKNLTDTKIVKTGSLKRLNITNDSDSARVILYHFAVTKADEHKIKTTLNSALNNFSNIVFIFQRDSPLQFVKVGSNVQSVSEGNEFILTCLARGSPSISFRWYKDEVLINVTLGVRGRWFQQLPYHEDQYVGLLGIERAELYDSGTYTCQVKDWEQQQCQSIKVEVEKAASVYVEPLNVVVHKGDSVKISCLAKNEQEPYGYIWMRNDRELLKTDPPHLYYEDLYRGGSVLYVNNVTKSEIFGCNSVYMRIDILDEEKTPFCKKDESWSITWPITGAGITALQKCPENYTDNIARRLCEMVDTNVAEWQLPDFSGCISLHFLTATEDFHKLISGYQNDSVTATNTLNMLWISLTARHNHRLLPGEGESVVNFLHTMYEFLTKTKKWSDFPNSIEYFYKIVDVLLQNVTSLLNREAVLKLSFLFEKWTSLWRTHEQHTRRNIQTARNRMFTNSSQFKSFEFYVPRKHGQVVKLHSNITVNFEGLLFSSPEDGSVNLSVIVYKNLSHLLLSNYSLNQRGDRELVYKLLSPIVHVLLPENPLPEKWNFSSSPFLVDFTFQLPLYKSRMSTKWDVCCGIVHSFAQRWNLNVCKSASLSPYVIHCSCNSSGMFAVFAAESPLSNDGAIKKYQFVVMTGCVFCFLQCVISLTVLLFRWLRIRSCLIYLKIQICVSTATAMLLFLYGSCDPSTDAFPYILSGLQMFLLASLSSHISVLIVMYIDAISLKNIPNIKISAISVMTVSPMLLIVFAPLTRKITNEKLKCWWLCNRTLLFYIHFIVGLFFLFLFLFLYCCVMKRLFFLWHAAKIERKFILQRISFLQYTLVIFVTTVVMVISSTIYVNVRTSTSQCVFGSSCALLGLVILLCYLPQNEAAFCVKIVFPMLKHSDLEYSPELQVISGGAGISRNSGTYETESWHSSHSDEKFESDVSPNLCEDSTDDSSSPKQKKKKSVVFHRDLVTVPEMGQTVDQSLADSELTVTEASTVDNDEPFEKRTKLEQNIVWPITQNNYISTSSRQSDSVRCFSPLHQRHSEILTTRLCVELGVMKNAADNVSPGDSESTVVICSVDVEPCPGHIVELNEVKFTANSIGSVCTKNIQKVNEMRANENVTVSLDQKQIDGNKTNVLDRISQDLDYLLNRSPSPTKSRENLRILNSPKHNVANVVKPKT